MFIHIFKYRFITLIKNPSMLFWTLAFPIILGAFFNFSFGSLNEHEKFNIIPIAVIDNEFYQTDEGFQSTMKTLSEGDEAMFAPTITNTETAEAMLANGEIAGLIIPGETMAINIVQSNINQSIIKIFLDQYSQTRSAVTTIVMQDPNALEQVITVLEEPQITLKTFSVSSAEPNNVLMYFYSLIAMTCLYASFFGLKEVIDIQANLSHHAARMNLVPVHKLKSFLYSSTASLLISFIEILILLAYLHYILGVDFGNRTGLVILTSGVGCVVGFGLGAFISAAVKGSEAMKSSICIAVSMFGSFLAGMMYAEMKYIVDTQMPILSKLNPVNVLTDAFYALYFYDSYDRFILNISILGGFAVVFCLGTYLFIRREKYASI